MDYPKLRYGVEAVPVEMDGQTMILLRDQLGFSDAPLVLSPAAAQILMGMDGTNTLRDLQAQFMRATGQLIHSEQLAEIRDKLDEHLFLDTERFHRKVAEEHQRFVDDPVRRMTHAGVSYSSDPALLQQELAACFLPESGGPGAPQPRDRQQPLLGLVAPHIDIKAGGTCYAHAYKTLCESQPVPTWMVLGTSHYPLENLFAVTCKDFETPLRTLSCDRQILDTLLRLAPRDLRADELNHRREHTIEFQAVFLALCQPSTQIVPVLCAFSLEDWEAEQAYIDEVAVLFREIAATCGYPVGFVASVDLAHIGPRYGDRFQPHAGTVNEHLAADRKLLRTLENCDPAGFIQILLREENRRRICGLAPLYLLARILEGQAHGQVLQHAHSVVDQHHSFVTYASMAFFPTDTQGGNHEKDQPV